MIEVHDFVAIFLGASLLACFWMIRNPKAFLIAGAGLVLLAVYVMLKFDASAGVVEGGVLFGGGGLVVCGFGFVRVMLARSVSLGALAGMDARTTAGGDRNSSVDLEARIAGEIAGRLTDLKQRHLVGITDDRMVLTRFGHWVAGMVSVLNRLTRN